MELDDSDQYAVAALFTLALHCTQVEVGVDRTGGDLRKCRNAWGHPSEELFDEVISGGGLYILPAADIEKFWGWESCVSGGLCERVYQNLNIPLKAFAGLLKLPEVVAAADSDTDGASHCISLVRSYARLLDPDLTFESIAAPEPSRSEYTQNALLQAVEQVASQNSKETEHATSDVQEQNLMNADNDPWSVPPHQPSDLTLALNLSDTPGCEPPNKSSDSNLERDGSTSVNNAALRSSIATVALSRTSSTSAPVALSRTSSTSAPVTDPEADKQCSGTADGLINQATATSSEGFVVPRAAFAPSNTYKHQTSRKALLAVYELIGACVTALPPNQSQVQATSALPGSSSAKLPLDKTAGSSKHASHNGKGRSGREQQPDVRWYDARARVAVKRVAHWLRLPWPQMCAFEQLWAEKLALDPSLAPPFQRQSRAMWYMAVGGASLGFGAALAVTGGLAAPALVAGLGAAVTMLHGGAAAATAVATYGSTSAGTAAITGVFGALGGSSAGSKTAALVGDVKEFGFWDISLSIFEDGEISEEEPKAGTAQNKSAEAVAIPAGEQAVLPVTDTSPLLLPGPSSTAQQAAPAPSNARRHSEPGTPTPTPSSKPSSTATSTGFTSRWWGRKRQETVPPAGSTATPPAARDGSSSDGGNDSSSSEDGSSVADVASVSGTEVTRLADDDVWLDSSDDEAVAQQLQEAMVAAGLVEREAADRQRAAGATDDADASTSGNTKPDPGVMKPRKRGWWGKAPARKLRPRLPVPVHPRRTCEAKLSLVLCVNGWVRTPEDFVKPWRGLSAQDSDRYALVWETQILSQLGQALFVFLRQKALERTGLVLLQTFFYTGLVAATAPAYALMSAINITLGSKWRLGLRRAQTAGRMLAHLLMAGCHGDRPVTLYGFSMGARLIFHCLLELCKHNCRGLVEHVVLLGVPVSLRPDRWAMARSVVAGRFINGYSTRDWVLGIIYRAHSRNGLIKKAGGLFAAEVPGIENFNLSRHIKGHSDYSDKMQEILEVINLHS